MGVDKHFQEYFSALDRSGHDDRCYLCRRSPSEVKAFFGFREDGTPIDAARYGIEDVTLEGFDIMSYRGTRPVCAVCQLNFETLFLSEEHGTLRHVLRQIEFERDELWPRSHDEESEPPE